MSRSNYDKPFYVDVGTSIVAVRCASNHDVVARYDHARYGKQSIEEAERICARLNAEKMSEACRAMNDDGDPALCEELDCPYYGEPNGCNSPCGQHPTTEKSSAVGNAAAMREALVKAKRVLHCAIVADILKGDDAYDALDAVISALSKPPRNCDAGTAAERKGATE